MLGVVCAGPNVHNVVITGGGAIDGNGGVAGWWALEKNGTLLYQRPRLVQLVNASWIRIANVTLRNSPFWTVHLVYCQGVVIENATILAPRDSPNTDGVDVDSSRDVAIFNNTIDVGDGESAEPSWHPVKF